MSTPLKIVLVIAACCVLVGFVMLIMYLDEEARKGCASGGGHVQEYTEQGMSCTTRKIGNTSYTDCHPVTYHKWRCVKDKW